MGLDSVELLMEVENYFKIRIPDAEAERICTVGEMVDTVARYLNVESTDAKLRTKIFQDVSVSLKTILGVANNFVLKDKIGKFLVAGEKDVWDEFERSLKMSVPRPDNYNPGSGKFSDKFRKIINWKPFYDWANISMEQFVDAICAHNYQSLLEDRNIESKHEIYVAVVGITVGKIGVDYFEISPEKSFTSDLGVD